VEARQEPAAGAEPVAANTAGRLAVFVAVLWWSAVALAVAGVVHCAVTGSGGEGPATAVPVLLGLSIAVVLAAFDPLLFIRIKTERGSVSYGFGEISFVAACYLVPPNLLPVTTLVGVFCAQLTNLWLGRLPSFSRVLSSAGALALSSVAGATVVAVSAGPVVGTLTPAGAAAVGAGAMTFCLVSVLLVSARNAMTPPTQPWAATLRPALWRKVPMGLGNTAVGLVGLTAVSSTPWSLLAVPPIIWLLHQTYAYRLRSDNERSAWRTFAAATQNLNHGDERSPVVAGLTGLRKLFLAHRAEIVIDGLDAEPRAFRLDDDGGSVTGSDPEHPADGPPVATRHLLVAGVRVGEVRLFGHRPLKTRELLMLGAFGDAFAASMHNAATQAELRALTKSNTYDSERDGVTGLANRRTLLRVGNASLGRLDDDEPVALLLFDVNHFREINTTLGHAAGDDLLRVTAYRLAADSGPGELLARLGGDEFALLLTGESAHLPTVLHRARRLADALSAPTVAAGVQVSIEASVGVATADRGDVDMAELLRRAETAMYRAKRERSTVSCYDSRQGEATVDRLAMLAELREALADDDQLFLLLHPTVALEDCRTVSVEALVRWRHPRRGELTPVHFVRTVEQSDLLAPFTRHVLDLALGVSARLRRLGVDVPVSVNLSPRSLLDSELPAVVADLLGRHGVPAPGLVFEIIETVAISRQPVVDEVLAGLRTLGVQLAVDDFGTGFSALTFLTQVLVDEIKIDRTFVTGMSSSVEAAAIVRTTIDLGRELGLRVVAEGVETTAQRKALVGFGCQLAQGFLFHRPVPVDVMVRTLEDSVPPPSAVPLRLVNVEHEPPG
jgi:diguanylate cyclase (GGDEF)-like protein